MADKQQSGERNPGGRKTKKAIFSKGADFATRKFDVEPGMAGVLAMTQLGRERDATNELNKLFTEYADKLYGSDDATEGASGDAEEKETSIEDAFASELSSYKKPKKTKRFYSLTTSIDCVVFFRVLPPIDPAHLVHTIMIDLANTKRKKTRFAVRLIPITKTCHASIPAIVELTKELTGDVFPKEEGKDGEGEGKSWMLEFKSRWNDNITRERLIQHVPELIPDRYKVDLGNPDIVLSYQVLKHICGMSILRDYVKFRRYNLEAILSKGLDLEGRKKRKAEGAESGEVGAGTEGDGVEVGEEREGTKKRRVEESSEDSESVTVKA
ncbi:hypothetical protein HDV00_009239 [Rhizophlyctis rosea]|nr:hypothetical protein HDV00_009239 [Rhizophlyctis rosea]